MQHPEASAGSQRHTQPSWCCLSLVGGMCASRDWHPGLTNMGTTRCKHPVDQVGGTKTRGDDGIHRDCSATPGALLPVSSRCTAPDYSPVHMRAPWHARKTWSTLGPPYHTHAQRPVVHWTVKPAIPCQRSVSTSAHSLLPVTRHLSGHGVFSAPHDQDCSPRGAQRTWTARTW